MDRRYCEGCKDVEPKQGGWCYMFEKEPSFCLRNGDPKDNERERFRKALDKIHDIANNSSTTGYAPELNQTIDKILKIAREALKEE